MKVISKSQSSKSKLLPDGKSLSLKAPAESIRCFREAFYGMFVHFGLYSIPGRGECVMLKENIPLSQYRQLAKHFNPRPDCVEDWVKTAKVCGMRYMCLTTRHGDSFALFDSKATDFKSTNSKANRDFVKEYVDACHKHGMKVGLYYSVADWTSRAYWAGRKRSPQGWRSYVDIVHEQLRELATNYGKIDYIFYDGCPPPHTWGAVQINAEIRRLQPHILLSDRCRLDEDVRSGENSMLGDSGKIWELCTTTNDSWGFNIPDNDWKTPRRVAHILMTCAHNRGNLLLNVGPDGDGNIPVPALDLLKNVSRWLDRNSEALYGTEPRPFDYADQRLSTSRGNTAYLALDWYYGKKTVIIGIDNKVKSARLLWDRKPVGFIKKGSSVHLTGLPAKSLDPYLPVVALELSGKPRGARSNYNIKYRNEFCSESE